MNEEKNENIIRPANGKCVESCPGWRYFVTGRVGGGPEGQCTARDRIRGLFGFGEVDGYSLPGGECPFAVLGEILGVNDLSTSIRNDGQCHACAKYPMGKCAPPRSGLCSMFEPVVASVPLPADPPSDDSTPHEPDLPHAEPAAEPGEKEMWERIIAASSKGLPSAFHQFNNMLQGRHLQEYQLGVAALDQFKARETAREVEKVRRMADALVAVRRDLYNILSAHPTLGLENHRWGEDRFCNCPRCQLGRLLDYIDASIKGPA